MNNNHIQTTEKTWDTIAESFDVTRKKPWPHVINFINNLSKSDTIADIGCGNGRHILPSAEKCKEVIGIDLSQNLLNIVKNKCNEKNLINVSLIHTNMIDTPFKNDSFDAILCIASLHNVKGRDNRIRSLKEINRILKNDGKALISVWSRWQDKYRYYFLKKLLKEKEEFGDINIRWTQHNLNIPRFYHLYSKREFIKDIHLAHLIIKKLNIVKLHSKVSADNYFAIVQKG